MGIVSSVGNRDRISRRRGFYNGAGKAARKPHTLKWPGARNDFLLQVIIE
jgi:hypothetical protein